MASIVDTLFNTKTCNVIKRASICVIVIAIMYMLYNHDYYLRVEGQHIVQPNDEENPKILRNILLYEQQHDPKLPNKSLSSNNSRNIFNNICVDDCLEFKKLLLNWPAGKPKAVIYLLTQSDRIQYLQSLFISLDLYFNNQFNYPIIIFHEKSFEPYIQQVKKLTNSSLFFQELYFSIPKFLEGTVPENITCYKPIGYRHMCRFHSKTMYEQPIFKDVKYYWRLDDDSLLLTPINYDVFKFMRENNFLYGYIEEASDSYECIIGLWETTERYINKNNLSTQFFSEWHRPKIIYNNFEISSFSIWTSGKYQKYIDYIDHAGGMYYHRWGDAPIKGIAVSMFVPRTQIYQFKDIGYEHDKHEYNPTNLGKMGKAIKFIHDFLQH